MEDKNPYANSDGSIKDGMQDEFWQWVEKQHDKKINKLSPKKRDDLKKAMKHMASKMNS